MPVGMVYLVGAGPGDPGLITAQGLDCIRQSEVLVYDRLVSPALVAQARSDAEKIYVGKEVGKSGRRQVDISELLANRALQGKLVCRLKGGDPFVFGRGGEEAEVLADRGVPFTIVPGVTSGVAAPAYAGIPVSHRDFAGAVTLVTGHDAPDKRGSRVDWVSLAQGNTTLLIYMGLEGIAEIADRLVLFGRSAETPVAVIRWGTRAEQQTLVGTLRTIADQVRATTLKAPAMIVVGDVVNLREQLNWAEWRPLFGRRVLVPTLARRESAVADVVRQAGAEVWEWEVGRAVPSADPQQLDAAIARLGEFDALQFADRDSVQFLLNRLLEVGLDARALHSLRILASTPDVVQELRSIGLQSDSSSELNGRRVLLVGGSISIDTAMTSTRAVGPRTVHQAVTHLLEPRVDTADLLRESLAEGAVQDLFFSEPETVSLLIGLVGYRSLMALQIFCRDEATARRAEEAGLTVQAVTPTGSELIRAVAAAGAAAIA